MVWISSDIFSVLLESLTMGELDSLMTNYVDAAAEGNQEQQECFPKNLYFFPLIMNIEQVVLKNILEAMVYKNRIIFFISYFFVS